MKGILQIRTEWKRAGWFNWIDDLTSTSTLPEPTAIAFYACSLLRSDIEEPDNEQLVAKLSDM